MKKLLPILGIIALTAVACNSVPDQNLNSAQAGKQIQDTVGMAAFNAWKAQNELASVNADPQPQETPEKTRTIVKYVPVKTSPSKQTSHTSSSSTSSQTGSGGSANSESSQTAKVEKKEGWSKAAKGAVIGGVTGAAGGAIINKKNRVVGAVIGGVIGAAGGYGIGRTMDKKDGRIDYSTILN